MDRTKITFDDGDTGRIYYDDASNVYASVTTILDRRENPDKAAALAYWREDNDGKNGNPYYQHIGAYSRWRGTLVHWYLIHAVDSSLSPTDEEHDAIDAIEAKEDSYEFVRSIALNHDYTFIDKVDWLNRYDNNDRPDPKLITDILWKDMSWCYERFASLLPKLGLAKQTFDESHYNTLTTHYKMAARQSCVIETETYLMNHEDRYAGQCDLLYETYDGTTVLADIKTSKRVYWSHKRQLAAYARAIERDQDIDCDTVDEYCVIRLSPDHRDTECSFSSEWDESHEQLYNEFTELNDRVQEQVADTDFESHIEANGT